LQNKYLHLYIDTQIRVFFFFKGQEEQTPYYNEPTLHANVCVCVHMCIRTYRDIYTRLHIYLCEHIQERSGLPVYIYINKGWHMYVYMCI